MQLIPLEKIHSSRDSVLKARESHLIDKAMTLEPHGHRDELLAVVTLQTFYLGKFDLLTVYLGKVNFLIVTDFSPDNLPRGNFIVWGLVMSREQ